MSNNKQLLRYDGSNFFRLKVILACLSGKEVRIQNIRTAQGKPGILDFEISFLRLIDSISNGSKLVVNPLGTVVHFEPGILVGGHVDHKCPLSRAIGYFLEPLLVLAPFCKKPLDITFRGVTNNTEDPSIDMIRYSLYPIVERFLTTNEGFILKMVKRGIPPNGGGVVHFKCPVIRTLKAFQWLDMGKIKKVRGMAFVSRIAPNVGNRAALAAREVFHKYISDFYITHDCVRCASPGYGLCLAAETNNGSMYSTEIIRCKEGGGENATVTEANAEDLGKQAAFALLEEIHNAGVVDSQSQPLILTFMVLTPQDVSKVVVGPLTPYTMNLLKLLKDFFGVTFKIEEFKEKNITVDEENFALKLGSPKLLLTCIGSGVTNIGKHQI